MARTTERKLILGLDAREFRRGIQNVDNQLKGLTKVTQNLGRYIGATFAVGVVADFAKEMMSLALEAEGVEHAFNSLGNATANLEALKHATRGTVTELDLMKQSVQAVNLGLDQADLPKYFEFARRRARATGESVEYLTNSIVTGLGRESKLIIDNLGIDMAYFNAQIKDGATFAEAFNEAMAKGLEEMPEDIELMTDHVNRLAAGWENAKKNVGGFFNRFFKDAAIYFRIIQARPESESFGPSIFPQDIGGEYDPDDDPLLKNITETAEQGREWAKTLEGVQKITEHTLIPTEKILGTYKFIRHEIEGTAAEYQSWLNAVNNQLYASDEMQNAVMLLSETLGSAFNAALINGENFFKSLEKAVVNLIKKLAIAAGLSAIIAGGSTFFGGSFAGMFKKVFTGLSGIKLAEGGIVMNRTTATIGEAGPEAVIPLNKMGDMIGGRLETTISGRDLKIILDRENFVSALSYGG